MTRIAPVTGADAVLARVPAVALSHAENVAAALGDGLVDAALKDLCARFLAEEPDAVATTPRERAALGWAEAIAWDSDRADDALWEALHTHFSEPQLVELGYAIAYTMGRQRWLATLGLAD